MTSTDELQARITRLSAEMDTMVHDLAPASPDVLAARRDRLREIENQLLADLASLQGRIRSRIAQLPRVRTPKPPVFVARVDRRF